MPLGALAPFARRLVAPVVGGGDAQIDHRSPVLHAADLRILSEIADQNHFVDAACHDCSPLKRRLRYATLVPCPRPPGRMLGLSTAAALFAFCSSTLRPPPQGQVGPKCACKMGCSRCS